MDRNGLRAVMAGSDAMLPDTRDGPTAGAKIRSVNTCRPLRPVASEFSLHIGPLCGGGAMVH